MRFAPAPTINSQTELTPIELQTGLCVQIQVGKIAQMVDTKKDKSFRGQIQMSLFQSKFSFDDSCCNAERERCTQLEKQANKCASSLVQETIDLLKNEFHEFNIIGEFLAAHN